MSHDRCGVCGACRDGRCEARRPGAISHTGDDPCPLTITRLCARCGSHGRWPCFHLAPPEGRSCRTSRRWKRLASGAVAGQAHRLADFHLPVPMGFDMDEPVAPVAQLDRAPPSEGGGQRFESSRVRQFSPQYQHLRIFRSPRNSAYAVLTWQFRLSWRLTQACRNDRRPVKPCCACGFESRVARPGAFARPSAIFLRHALSLPRADARKTLWSRFLEPMSKSPPLKRLLHGAPCALCDQQETDP